MEAMFGLDYEYFSKKLMSEKERKLLDHVDISLLVDPQTHSISRAVYYSDIPKPEVMIEQDQIIDRFMHQLYEDVEVKAIL